MNIQTLDERIKELLKSQIPDRAETGFSDAKGGAITTKYYSEKKVMYLIRVLISEVLDDIVPDKVLTNHALQKQSDRDIGEGWNGCIDKIKDTIQTLRQDI